MAVMVNAIDDSVGTDNNLPNAFIAKFWNDPPEFWKLRECLGSRDKELAEGQRPIRGVN
jgi:hypothetical protein